MWRSSLTGEPATKLQDATTRIYEACSFQDITGQRITKVVTTLKTIEAKVAQIVATFGSGDRAAPIEHDSRTDRDGAAERPAASRRRDGSVRHRQAAGQLRMRPRAATWPLAALLGVLPLASAFADSLPPVPVRVGNHEGYSRVVFDLPSRTDYHVTQQGQHVVVQFAGDVTIGAANGVPRNVLTVTGGAGRAEIVVAPGTIVRDWRLGNVVVMDFMDHDAAIADKPTTQETVATQPPPANPGPGVTPSDAPSARPVQPPSTKSPVTPPAALAAQAARPPPIKPPPHITLPAAPAPQTGAPADQAAQPPPAKQPPGVTPPAAPALRPANSLQPNR